MLMSVVLEQGAYIRWSLQRSCLCNLRLFIIYQVAGETETKGQIKLRFKTTAGRDVVCIRSFQLTQKASKLEYKAVESVLQTIDPRTGEVSSSQTLSMSPKSI